MGANLYDAEVVKILPSANPDTQRYAVQLEVDIAQHLLAPGLTGEVSINVGERPGARIIRRGRWWETGYLWSIPTTGWSTGRSSSDFAAFPGPKFFPVWRKENW